jgi:hypothetical protein
MRGAEATMDEDIASGMRCLPSTLDAQLGPSDEADYPPEQVARPRRLASALITSALKDLANCNRTATRQTVMEATGLSYSIVDDHIKRRIVDGTLRRVVNGVFEMVADMPEDRAISITHMPGGTCKLEIGDFCVELTLREARMVGLCTVGVTAQFGRSPDSGR